MKVALVSETLPPSKTGQGIVLYRLLQARDPREYCLISVYPWAENATDYPADQQRGKYYQITPRFAYNQGYGVGLSPFREGVNIPFGILHRAGQIAKILRGEKCQAVVACTGDLLDLPAAFLAARRVGIPFYAYVFDHYSYREWIYPAKRFWARRLEPLLLRRAAGVVVPNEVLGDTLRERYGVVAHVIHNSFDLSPYQALPSNPMAHDGEIKIVYTGDIYEAHYDAFQTLLEAIKRLQRPEIRLHLYTERTTEELATQGISGPIVLHSPLPPEEIPRVQRESSLLFLALAFDSPYPELVKTSSTTKLGEYLGARRPVIVHAPPESFVSWYFRTHECGVVIDRRDPALMAESIERVLLDPDLEHRLSERAWEQARSDFDIETARTRFWNIVTGNELSPAKTRIEFEAD